MSVLFSFLSFSSMSTISVLKILYCLDYFFNKISAYHNCSNVCIVTAKNSEMIVFKIFRQKGFKFRQNFVIFFGINQNIFFHFILLHFSIR